MRFYLGDTDVAVAADALYSDEAISAALTVKTSVEAATAFLAQGLVARFSRDPVKVTAGGQTFDFSDRLPAWRRLAVEMTAASATDGALTFVDASYGADDEPSEY